MTAFIEKVRREISSFGPSVFSYAGEKVLANSKAARIILSHPGVVVGLFHHCFSFF